MFNIYFIIIPIVSYLIGSISPALIFNKTVNKIDPRETGSKNLGALNTLRITSKNHGKLIGILGFLTVFLIDAFKGALCVWLTMQVVPDSLLAICLATFFVILGHNYSILLKLEGGRGAATFLGILLFLNWKMFLIFLGTILLFMFIFQLIIPVKGKGFFKTAISDQIIGRLVGEVAALIPFWFMDPNIFWIGIAGIPLILIRHIDRIKKQVKDYK